MADLDTLIKRHSGCSSWDDLINGSTNYRPTFIIDHPEKRTLIKEYNKEMKRKGDCRRAYISQSGAKYYQRYHEKANELIRIELKNRRMK